MRSAPRFRMTTCPVSMRNPMQTSDFNYELPPELIARAPVRPRDSSRMMLLNRKSGSWTDSRFQSLPELLGSSDVLVLNDTRVIPARVYGRLERATGTSREIEVFFAAPVSGSLWEVLCRPGKRIRAGDRVVLGNGELQGIFGGLRAHGLRLLHLNTTQPVHHFLERHGHIPLPPYLEREETAADGEAYQTVYARMPGAVAAPTAGLHFTPRVFKRIHARGIEVLQVTLHVGVGTFIPVRSQNPAEHQLKPER